MINPTPRPSEEVARSLYQAHLDETTRYVLQGDMEAYSAHVAVPYVFRTAAGEHICETVDELNSDVRAIHEWLKSVGATDYYRIARRARFVSDDVIEGYHVTYVLRGAIPIVEPYSNRMILRQRDGRWYATAAEHELTDPLANGRVIKASPGTFASAWNTETNLATRDQDMAGPLYQSLLKDMSDAQNTLDFDGWSGMFTYPYHVHYDASDHVAETPDDVRPFFDAIKDAMSERGADGLVRRSSFASFVSDDRLLGYHDTIMNKGDEIVFGPVKSRMIFVLTDEGWKCSSVTNSLSNTGFPGGAFKPSNLLPTMRQIQKRMRT